MRASRSTQTADLPCLKIVLQSLLNRKVTPDCAPAGIFVQVLSAASQDESHDVAKGQNPISIGVILVIGVAERPLAVGTIGELSHPPRAAACSSVAADGPSTLDVVPVRLCPWSEFQPPGSRRPPRAFWAPRRPQKGGLIAISRCHSRSPVSPPVSPNVVRAKAKLR